MDEVFWSNVVKRWSDASENVITLKKELAKVQEERALYRSLVNNLRRNDVRDLRQSDQIREESPHSVPEDDDINSTIQDELQDAEVGLSRAKEEYRRLQQEIKALTLENEKLSLDHKEQITKLRDELYHSKAIEKDPPKNSPPKRTLLEKRIDDERGVSTQPGILQPQVVIALQRQIDGLQQLLEARESDNQRLRDELAITHGKLQKAEDNSKVLLTSIVKLQEIARHSASGVLHPISTNFLRPDSRKSSKLSFSSINRSRISDIEPAERTKTSVDNALRIDEKSVIEENTSGIPFSLPPGREEAVAKLPSAPNVVVNASENIFDREFLKDALGDGVQSLIEHLPANRMDKKAIVSSYLCPTLNHHPWCPSRPGQHGFLFVGLGKDKESYKSPVTRNLFVGLPKSHTRTRTFRYLGKYEVARVKPLSVEEWTTLANDVKHTYAKLTKDKCQDPRSSENIMLSYDMGDLLVPCVQLQYLGFDDSLYAALLSYKKVIRKSKAG
ncbi:hypothetical protein GALMADRAFT_233738 [Galerina marginata CBS 339.88]|uniref:DUF6697 domain-containing protein n=1 Tax=Galerina marginata (strain CBS 339.88) TaxID=685588 RepID=A0A067TS12_GALM3|nr:hypothetical protein GALMADRAFT_233738 [Galerina marginata CBS 339.88]